MVLWWEFTAQLHCTAKISFYINCVFKWQSVPEAHSTQKIHTPSNTLLINMQTLWWES